MRPFGFDRAFALDADPAAVWDALGRTDDYPRWWPWLRSFRADGLRPGTAVAVIGSPLGYRLRVEIHVLEVVPARLVRTEVAGDLAGPARLDLVPAGVRGCSARLRWELELRQPVLRRIPAGRHLMEWAHDRVVDRALRDFCDRALRA